MCTEKNISAKKVVTGVHTNSLCHTHTTPAPLPAPPQPARDNTVRLTTSIYSKYTIKPKKPTVTKPKLTRPDMTASNLELFYIMD